MDADDLCIAEPCRNQITQESTVSSTCWWQNSRSLHHHSSTLSGFDIMNYLNRVQWSGWYQIQKKIFCGFPPIGSSRESRYEQVLWSWLGCRFHPQSQRALLRWDSMLASSVCVGFIQEAQNVVQTSVWPCWIFYSIYSSCTHIVHVVWFEAVWMAPQVLLLSVSHLFLSPPPLFFMSKLGKTENYTQIAGTNCSL